jgi:hypothetical protein
LKFAANYLKMLMSEMTYKRQILPFWMTQGSD